ncbi:MAG: arsenite efflux transporter metallochaperone ArsD [Thermoleophilia bacterium]|nr:arsenite efflux transporter metallochaperone ArsD [Thermoleophilia bacterium]
MKIELFEPAMCCSSGVCGPSVDPKLVKLQETLRLIEEQGAGKVEVNRYNLSTNLDAFAKNAAIGEVLKEQGPQALPVVYIDGELIIEHRYPTTEEWRQALGTRGIDIDLNDGQEAIETSRCQPADASDCGPGCC